jgi:ABC-2 type transport system ATP-binding protein
MMSGNPELAIEADHLCRVFRGRGADVLALHDVSLRIEPGQVVGVLGANGAGKTTLSKILGTLLLPTSGSVRVFDCDVASQARQVRRVTGVVFGGDRGLYGRLSGRDNVRFFAVLAGVDRRRLRLRVEEVLTEVGLQDVADRRVETYSRGMRQRLHIAIGTVAAPRLLILDEPTVGLDPVEAERLRGAIAGLRDTGVTILLTSHYLLDIERLADRVMVLHEGSLARDLPIAEFVGLAGFTATVELRGTGRAPDAAAFAGEDLEVASVQGLGDRWVARLRVRRWDESSFQRLARGLEGVSVSGVDVAPVRLEDVYADLSSQLTVAAGQTAGGASG